MQTFELVGQALLLRREAFEALDQGIAGLRLALGVVFLAGVSMSFGQSLVLFANRVRQRRFIASLILSGTIFTFTYLFWAASIWLVAGQVFGQRHAFLASARTVGLAYSPQLFGVLVLTPYFGSFIAAVLSVWNLLALLVAVRVVFDLQPWQAVLTAGLGWALLQLVHRTIGWPLQRLTRWVRRTVAGRALTPLRDAVNDEWDH